MSLILDALKKADEDRPETANTVMVQPELPVSFPSPEKNTSPYIWVGAVAGCIVLAIILFLIMGGDKQTPTANYQQPSNAIAEPATSVIEQANPIQQATKPEPVIAVDPTAIDALYEAKPASLKKSEIDSLYGQAENEVKAETKTVATKAQPMQVTTKPKAEITKESQEPVAQTTQAQKTAQEYLTLADYPGVKNIRDLPANIQLSIPTLMYTDHIYAESALDIIMLNRMPLRNNDISPEGVRVERIVEDGAILVYKGYRFKIFALNSWVNL